VIKEKFGGRIDAWVEAAVPFLLRRPIDPNLLSVLGVLISLGGAFAFGRGSFFAGGLRVVDISDAMRPREIAWYVPEVSTGMPQSNDVYVDGDGLIYLVDRFEGVLDILEHAGV